MLPPRVLPRAHCMLRRFAAPHLSAFIGRQPACPAATCSFAAVQKRPFASAAQPQRPMGFSWPFGATRRKSSDSSRLQHLLDVSTAFSREPSAKSLQAVKAALGELLAHESVSHGCAV